MNSGGLRVAQARVSRRSDEGLILART